MRVHIKLSLLLLLVSWGTFAQESLYKTMVDVNARWTYETDYPQEVYEPVSITNPIQTHLFLVHKTLSQRATSHLSPQQKANREASLKALWSYAEEGAFPNNFTHPYRTPIFIGPKGNYCAVGHLLKESGYDAIAQQIKKKMNYAYLLDMQNGDLTKWVAQSGFTPEELAWIQPGYSPNPQYQKMKDGFNGPVSAFSVTSSGELLVGGRFDSSGTMPIQGLAQWMSGIAGFDWLPYSSGGVRYEIFDIEHFNGG